MKRWSLFASTVALVGAMAGGCSTLDAQQREWIFQPSDRSYGGSANYTQGMEEVWIDFGSRVTGRPARLNALWLPAQQRPEDKPVLLYLHGARWNVSGFSRKIVNYASGLAFGRSNAPRKF